MKVKKYVRKGDRSRGDNTVDVEEIKGSGNILNAHTVMKCVNCQCANDLGNDVGVDLHENVPQFEEAQHRYETEELVEC